MESNFISCTVLSLWTEFLKIAKQEVGTQVVETWFKCVTLENWNSECKEVVLCAPNQFVSNWVSRNYLETLKTGLGRLLNTSDFKITFKQSTFYPQEVEILDTKNFENNSSTKNIDLEPGQEEKPKIWPARPDKNQASHQAAMIISMDSNRADKENPFSKKELSAKKIGICPEYSFENFIIGPHNHLAYSASLAVSRGAIKGYNPLFIYGKTGLGKTHLLNCIGNETKEIRPSAKIVYKTSDKFVDEFIRSIRFDKIHHFKEKYCATDLLLIDDIQFLSQKEQTQEIFFHIFNSMHEQNKQIVLSSDMPPSQIRGLQERLKSRFEWGLIADIQPPAFETRIAILMKKADAMGINISHSVAEKIASRVNSNIRELEGTLTRLSTISILKGIPISIDLIDRELKEQKSCEFKSGICPNELLRSVAKAYAITPVDIKSKRRDNTISTARQLTMYLLRKHSSFSLRTIGEFLGGRSHATVLHAIDNISLKVTKDPVFSKKVNVIVDSFPQNDCA